MLTVGLVVAFFGGLPWAWLCYKFFFFLLESRANKFFYLFEGVPTFVTKGVPKYRANIKNFNNYIQKKKKFRFSFRSGSSYQIMENETQRSRAILSEILMRNIPDVYVRK